MIETVRDPTFQRSDFDHAHKKPGLSALVRLRNEEDFAAQSLESILPYFDEIVIVFNCCTDRTPEIVADIAQRNPALVKAYHYVPEVFPQGSSQYRQLPPDSVHSLVHYANFALSRASYQIRCKWDGDQIAIPDAFGQAVQRIRNLKPRRLAWWLSPWKLGYSWFTGVNLWDRDGGVYVPRIRPLVGKLHDIGFFPAERLNLFKHYAHSEYLFTRLMWHRYIGCLFFHLKGMKKDRGVGVYQLDKNPDSPYMYSLDKAWSDPELYTFEELRTKEPQARNLPKPEALGIHPIVAR